MPHHQNSRWRWLWQIQICLLLLFCETANTVDWLGICFCKPTHFPQQTDRVVTENSVSPKAHWLWKLESKLKNLWLCHMHQTQGWEQKLRSTTLKRACKALIPQTVHCPFWLHTSVKFATIKSWQCTHWQQSHCCDCDCWQCFCQQSMWHATTIAKWNLTYFTFSLSKFWLSDWMTKGNSYDQIFCVWVHRMFLKGFVLHWIGSDGLFFVHFNVATLVAGMHWCHTLFSIHSQGIF